VCAWGERMEKMNGRETWDLSRSMAVVEIEI
jgi:hypothetical protein